MPSLDKAFSDFLKSLRGEQSYASLASKLGIAESTRPHRCAAPATLRVAVRAGEAWRALPGLHVNTKRVGRK